MGTPIDTAFDMYSDTPSGKDPDSHSPTLRRYHKWLWSKPLPDGSMFTLSDQHPKSYLCHRSARGEFSLSSDSIAHTYQYTRAMSPIVEKMPQDELKQFFLICSTIGAYVVFPSRKVDRKPTINGARGLNVQIKDRFDLTLECIRLHYLKQSNPLDAALARYTEFFDLFGSFERYVDFFLLQDLVSGDCTSVNFYLPFRDFSCSPLPTDVGEYRSYKNRVVEFILARNCRIASHARSES